MATLVGKGTVDYRRLGAMPSPEACSGEVADTLLLVTQWYRPQLASAVIIAGRSSGMPVRRMSHGERAAV